MLDFLRRLSGQRPGAQARRDPIDEPEIARMSAAELADLPLPRHATPPQERRETAPLREGLRATRPERGLGRAAAAL